MSAIQAIRLFRLRELKGLQDHIQRFGHLLNPSNLEPLSNPTPQNPPPHHTLPNPFLPLLNPKTGRWAPPKYSLRRQAELIKKAKASNTLRLLPSGPKFIQPSPAPGIQAPKRLLENKDETVSFKDCWADQVAWDGKVKEKKRSRVDVRRTLYSGRKRMFKGHKWERTMKNRENRKKILMRDMAKRVKRFKEYHKRRKPDPLKPARSTKARKLPF